MQGFALKLDALSGVRVPGKRCLFVAFIVLVGRRLVFVLRIGRRRRRLGFCLLAGRPEVTRETGQNAESRYTRALAEEMP